MKRIVDMLLGIDPASWAADGQWRLEWLALPRSDMALVALGVVVIGVWVIVWLYRREGRGIPRGHRVGLTTLRLLALAGVVAMLLEPAIVFSRQEWSASKLIVLKDVSESMQIRDAYVDPTAAAQLAEALELPGGIADLREQTRGTLVDRVLDEGLLTALGDGGNRDVRVHPFAARMTNQPQTDTAAAPMDGSVSALGTAIRQALASYRGQPVAGILIVSDGQNNAGDAPARAAEAAAAEGVPIVALAAGTPQGPRNAAITRLDASPVIFVRDPAPVRAVIESRGMEQSTAAVVLERRRDGGPWDEIGRQEITLEAEGYVQTVEFSVTEPRPARLELRARLDETGPELTGDDNVALAEVRAIRQKIRTLFIAGSTFPEVEFIRNTLLRDTGVSVSTWLQTADATYEHPGNPPIRRLPQTQEELNDFDCVVLYDPDPQAWPSEFGPMLARFVSDAGGGLVFVAGERWTRQLFDHADDPSLPFMKLLPVVVDPGLYQTEVTMRLSARQAWRLQATPEGQIDPVLRFVESRDENDRVLASLPGMYWHFPVTRAKPGATVLARHGDPRMRNEYGGHVLLATQLVGPGRTVFIGFDSTYRWRFIDEQAFDGFWARVIDRAGRSKQLGGRYPFALSTDRSSYRPGSQVRLTARFDSDAERDSGIDALHGELEAGDQPPLSITLVPSGSDPLLFETTIPIERAGPHMVRVWSGEPELTEGTRAATLQIAVDLPNAEYDRPGQDRATLQIIANTSGGAVFDLSDADQIPGAFKVGKVARVLEDRQEIWDAPVLFGLVLALVFCEWVWRKRVRLV